MLPPSHPSNPGSHSGPLAPPGQPRRIPFPTSLEHLPDLSRTAPATATWDYFRDHHDEHYGIAVFRINNINVTLPMAMLLDQRLADIYKDTTPYGRHHFVDTHLARLLKDFTQDDDIICYRYQGKPLLSAITFEMALLGEPCHLNSDGVRVWEFRVFLARYYENCKLHLGGLLTVKSTAKRRSGPTPTFPVTFFSTTIKLDRGQQTTLANRLRRLYESRCFVSATISPSPEAAHIWPVRRGDLYMRDRECGNRAREAGETLFTTALKMAYETAAALPLRPDFHTSLDNLDHAFLPLPDRAGFQRQAVHFHWTRGYVEADHRHLQVMTLPPGAPGSDKLNWHCHQAFRARCCRSGTS